MLCRCLYCPLFSAVVVFVEEEEEEVTAGISQESRSLTEVVFLPLLLEMDQIFFLLPPAISVCVCVIGCVKIRWILKAGVTQMAEQQDLLERPIEAAAHSDSRISIQHTHTHTHGRAHTLLNPLMPNSTAHGYVAVI